MSNTRRPTGTGSLSRLKDGRYCVTFTDPTGERIFRYRKSRGDAEKILATLIANDGASAPPAIEHRISEGAHGPTLAEWLASQGGKPTLRHNQHITRAASAGYGAYRLRPD